MTRPSVAMHLKMFPDGEKINENDLTFGKLTIFSFLHSEDWFKDAPKN